MKNPLMIPELKELLKKKKLKVLESFLKEGHAREIAELIEMLPPDDIWKLMSFVEAHRSVEIFGYLDMDVQVEMVSSSLKKNVADFLVQMSHDDRADLFQHLDKNVSDKLLLMLPVSERADVIKLTSYSEDTVGAIMTTDFATLNENETVEKSIRKIRKEAPSKETIYYIYVTDDNDKLIGFVSLRKLILARPKQLVKNLMATEIIYITSESDRENATMLIDEFDLLALPVVDLQSRIIGIVTYDDAIDIIVEEQTEDMEKLMAISGGVEQKPYLDVPALVHFRKRVFWVVTLGLFGLLTGLIVEAFQKTIETLIVLTFYIPLLNAAGGNTGSQSATVILRSLTLKELSPSDLLDVIKKEFVISFLLCLILGAVTFARVYLFPATDLIPPQFSMLNVSLVIGISLALQVLWSTIFGAIVPIFATKLKLDPAIVSSPLLTTFVDMGGIVIYFSVAKIILGI